MNVTSAAAMAGYASPILTALRGGGAWPSAGKEGIDFVLGTPVEYSEPAYYKPSPSILPQLSDKYLSLLAPIVVYWVVSLWFEFLDRARFPFFEKYRLHEPEEITQRNRVSVKRVITMVAVQQIIQTILGIFVLEDEETVLQQVFADHRGSVKSIAHTVGNLSIRVAGYKSGSQLVQVLGAGFANWLYWWAIPTVQFVWAFFLMDAWQYILHRSFHESRFLYKHFHSHHHRLYVPYAFGALYNHPLEGLLLDSGGAAMAHAASFMTVRQGILLFAFSTLKTVCDHGGYAFPVWLDPLHLIFPNTAEYHDVHHQMQGLRYNYSQPFFIHFDVLCGTRMSAEKFAKMRAVNERRRKEAAGKKDEGAAQAPISAEKVVAEDSAATLRKRVNGDASHKDLSPEEIALQQGPDGDATVTTNPDSYRAKAGTAT